jgi:hypothetical protein
VKFRPNILHLLLAVAILGILAATLVPTTHHRLPPVKEQEMFGYWIAIPGAHEAFRLFLTNGGAGCLGSREIYTNLYRVASWHVTNREISIDLEPVTEPSWPHEYIRGKIGFSEIIAVRGGLNQRGEHWKRDINFFREETVLQDLGAASAIMTNHPQITESNGAASRSQPVGVQTNPTSATAGSGRSPLR